MIYLNECDMKKTGVLFDETIDVIKYTVECMENGKYAQPIKPYLRYGNPKNRIIAMPSFVGGNVNVSGIKWIASFPDNIEKGLPRAHSVLILNEAETGKPICVINTALLSIVRTSSVSGLVLKKYLDKNPGNNLRVGIIGWGPIGQYHFKMCTSLLGDRLSQIYLYDKRPVIDIDAIDYEHKDKIAVANSWEEVYGEADVFITCTVSEAPYIDKKPKAGSLHLNVSLRDYKTDVYEYFKDSIIVDEWEEVCREGTDIEMMHIEKGLQKQHTKDIRSVVCKNCMDSYGSSEPIMFNPMGMAAFDVAIGNYYLNKAIKNGMGIKLE